MKTLNLKSFAVAMLLAATFATLPPYQAQAVVLMPTPEMLQQHLEKFLVKEGIQTSDIDIKALAADPQAVYKIKQAQKALKKFANQMYIEYGSDVTIDISTNAPPGLTVSGSTNEPTAYMPPLEKSDGGVVPKFVIAPWCLYVLICIIVGGIAYWIKVKICKALDRLFPPKTNDDETTSFTSSLNTSSLNTAPVSPTATDNELLAMGGSCRTIWTTDQNPTSLYTFAIQSASNLCGAWTTSYTICITNGLANMPFGGVGIYDGNGNPLQQSSGDLAQVLRVTPNELQPFVRLQFLPSTNYGVYPLGSPLATNFNVPTVILPPTFNIR